MIVGLLQRDSRSFTLQKLLHHGVIAGLLPPFLRSFFRFLWVIFDAKRVKHLTLNALSIRLLSCVICGRRRLRSEIRAIFEGTKNHFCHKKRQKMSKSSFAAFLKCVLFFRLFGCLLLLLRGVPGDEFHVLPAVLSGVEAFFLYGEACLFAVLPALVVKLF